MLSASARGPGAPEWSLSTTEGHPAGSNNFAAAHCKVGPYNNALGMHSTGPLCPSSIHAAGGSILGQVGLQCQRCCLVQPDYCSLGCYRNLPMVVCRSFKQAAGASRSLSQGTCTSTSSHRLRILKRQQTWILKASSQVVTHIQGFAQSKPAHCPASIPRTQMWRIFALARRTR